jgi:hypothetical protein
MIVTSHSGEWGVGKARMREMREQRKQGEKN